MLPFLLRMHIYNEIRQEYEKRTQSNHIETPGVLQGAPSSADIRKTIAHFSSAENKTFSSIQLSNISVLMIFTTILCKYKIKKIS